jgi:hypothetical protein
MQRFLIIMGVWIILHCALSDTLQEFLDSLVTDTSKSRKEPVDGGNGDDGETTPHVLEDNKRQSSGAKLSRSNLASATVVDAAVDVILSLAQPDGNPTLDSLISKMGPIQANMIISVWELEGVKYFTLTFTSAMPSTTSTEAKPSSRTVTRTITSIGKPHSSVSSNSSSRRSLIGSGNSPSPSATSPMIKVPSFPPHGPPSSGATSSHSVFLKASQLKASDGSFSRDCKLT